MRHTIVALCLLASIVAIAGCASDSHDVRVCEQTKVNETITESCHVEHDPTCEFKDLNHTWTAPCRSA